MPLTDLLRDRQFMMKVVLVAFLSSLVFIGIGAYFMIMELIG
jgi:hypothetical protein